MIGDPSGKATERQLLSWEQIDSNVEAIKVQLARLLDFETKTNPARVMNNANWLMSLNLIDFLRDIGKHFTINYMMAKDSVKTRLDREDGISFTEFSYMLLQSYDFLHLYDEMGCRLQTGGSDQWGNITAGVELIRRMRGQSAFGMVYPLITKADGTKFGKTESGSVWLSAKRTSPYRFYQFWLNTDDKDVVGYLKFFTWLSQDEIQSLENELNERPEDRSAQRILAQHMTRQIHGETELAQAELAAKVLFGNEIAGLTSNDVADIFADVPSSVVTRNSLSGKGLALVDLLQSSNLVKSKGEARRAISEGGIYLNNQRVNEPSFMVSTDKTIEGKFIVLRRGRKNYHLVKIQG